MSSSQLRDNVVDEPLDAAARAHAEFEAKREAHRRGRLRRILGANWSGYLGLIIIVVIILCAVLAPWITAYDPTHGVLRDRLLAPGSSGHLLGTDALGRDLLTRVIYGSRISLAVGFLAVGFAAAIGLLAGLAAGYFGGWIDRVVMRIVDVQLSFPFVLLALTIAAILGPSFRNIILTLVISSWVLYARLVRGEVINLRDREFVTAARALGQSDLWIVLRHILPNVVNSVVVFGSLEVGRMIIAEASISFLGYGIQPPDPAWGTMLSEGRVYMSTAWWLTAFPGLFIVLTTLAVNLAGDWLRDRLDPRMRGR